MIHTVYASLFTALLLLLLPPTLHSADIRFLQSLSSANRTEDDSMGFVIVPGYRSNAHHFLLGKIEHANVGFVNCIEICRTNAKCLAVTFQVGKCLLYGRDGEGEWWQPNSEDSFLSFLFIFQTGSQRRAIFPSTVRKSCCPRWRRLARRRGILRCCRISGSLSR
jgi:hypothetical protein